MAQNDLKEMLEAAVHFGHKTQKWNPKMKKYIFGSRNGIHIFDLAKSKDCLDKAMEYLKMVSASGKKVLLVSTKPQAAQLILETAEATNMPYVIHKWIGGLITNFSTIKQRIKYLRNLKEQEKTGEIEKYTKKEASDIKKNIIKLEAALGGVKDLDRVPDVIFVADAVRDQIVIKEANKVKVPVVAIVDSNADPDGVAYPIPGNDDAIKSLTYLINKVKSAIMEGRGK
ncbi:MAG TPA: 30S ribosomal protein S2 [Candidatus Gracilibacteria bacterium]|nr:30S ribosomal protein S2 [Candidatus Gracilibacteria bacterium]